MKTEQFTRLQTSFVVLGTLLKSGCLCYNTWEKKAIIHWVQRPSVGLVSYLLQDHVAGEKAAGFPHNSTGK